MLRCDLAEEWCVEPIATGDAFRFRYQQLEDEKVPISASMPSLAGPVHPDPQEA